MSIRNYTNKDKFNLTHSNLMLPFHNSIKNVRFYKDGLSVNINVGGSREVNDISSLFYDIQIEYGSDKNIFNMDKSHILEHCLIPKEKMLKYKDKLAYSNLYTYSTGSLLTNANINKTVNYLYNIIPSKEELLESFSVVDEYNVDVLRTLKDPSIIDENYFNSEKEIIKSELSMSFSKNDCFRSLAMTTIQTLFENYLRESEYLEKFMSELKNNYNFSPIYRKNESMYSSKVFTNKDVDNVTMDDLKEQASSYLYNNSVRINMHIDSKILDMFGISMESLSNDEGIENLLNMILPNYYPLLKNSIKYDKNIINSDKEYVEKSKGEDLVDYKVISNRVCERVIINKDALNETVESRVHIDEELNSNIYKDIESIRVLKFLNLNKFNNINDLIIKNPKEFIRDELEFFVVFNITDTLYKKFRFLQDTFYQTYVYTYDLLYTEMISNYYDLKFISSDYLNVLPLKKNYRMVFENYTNDAKDKMNTPEGIKLYLDKVEENFDSVINSIDRDHIKKEIFDSFFRTVLLRLLYVQSHSYSDKQKAIYGSSHPFVELIDNSMDKEAFKNITVEQIKNIVNEIMDDVISDVIDRFRTSESRSIEFKIE